MNGNDSTRISVVEVVRYEGGDLYAVIKRIVSEHRTGRLTLNVSQGSIGSLEWQGAGTKPTTSTTIQIDMATGRLERG